MFSYQMVRVGPGGVGGSGDERQIFQLDFEASS